jgi:hypothetical protein
MKNKARNKAREPGFYVGLTEEPGFYVGPFKEGTRCSEGPCQAVAFSATDDNRVRCYEHTLSYLTKCAEKATRTPKKAFDALREELKRVHDESARRN